MHAAQSEYGRSAWVLILSKVATCEGGGSSRILIPLDSSPVEIGQVGD